MILKEKLQIILITYNRAKYVENTLSQFFYEGSPVSDCEFVVQDNNSTDNTAEVVAKWQKKYSNIIYRKNRYNVGLQGNILKAMEFANKNYVWILGDDDKFDFSNWSEVEKAIDNDEKIICTARYALPDEHKNNPAYQLLQLTFITGGIYNTTLFNDTVIKNAYDNVFTLFPHAIAIINYINYGGKIYSVNKAISDTGYIPGKIDCSYTRGYKDRTDLYDRTNSMSWMLGYANVITLIKDKKLMKECFEVIIPHKDLCGGWDMFKKYMYEWYINQGKISYFLEIYNVLKIEQKKKFNLTKVIKKAYAPKVTFWDYHSTRLLSKITFGKTRKHYKEKKAMYKILIKQYYDEI